VEDVYDVLGLVVGNARYIHRNPLAIAVLATLSRIYNCEHSLDNFFEVAPCVMG
jgi:hypothetical protein